MSKIPEQVVATQDALMLLKEMKEKHGSIIMYQSGGCCDGSTPYCYEEGDFKIGSNDKLLGYLGEIPFYIHQAQYEFYKSMQLIINVKEGNGSEFSLEYGSGRSFYLQSRMFSDEEVKVLRESGRI